MEDHIRWVQENYTAIPPDHVGYLKRLRSEGFEPKVVYDIGSCVLHWTREAEEIWPAARIFCFEANTDLRFVYGDVPHPLFSEVLSDRDGRPVRYYKSKMFFNGNSYYKENNEATFRENEYEIRQTRSLDSIVREHHLPLPDLIKIDVQGAETDILRGASETIRDCERLIVELQCVEYNRGALRVEESLPIIEGMGFECVDPLFCNNGPDGDYGFRKKKPVEKK